MKEIMAVVRMKKTGATKKALYRSRRGRGLLR